MSDIPLPPAVTRMVLTAMELGCLKTVATIAATFSTRPIFVRPEEEKDEADAAHEVFRVEHSDFLTALKAITAWRADSDRQAFATEHYLHQTALEEILDVEAQILAIMAEDGEPITDRRASDAVGKSIASGLVANLLLQVGTKHEYRSRCLDGIRIFPGSALHGRMTPAIMVASGIVDSTRLYAQGLHAVPPAWLPDIIPDAETLSAIPAFRFLKRTAKHAKRRKERHDGSRKHRDRRGRRR